MFTFLTTTDPSARLQADRVCNLVSEQNEDGVIGIVNHSENGYG